MQAPQAAATAAPAQPAFQRVLDGKLIASVVATALTTFAGIVGETAMNVTFPALMSDFSVDTATVQWITTGYLLMISCVIALSSFLKRRFRIRSLFLVAVAVFLVGVVTSIAAPTFYVLLAGRLLQGVGLGIALPLMYNIILEQAPFDKTGLLMGVGTLVVAASPGVGPFLGGLILSTVGWRFIFVAQVPVLVVSFLLGMYGIREVSKPERAPFALGEYLLLVVCFVCAILGINAAATSGWTSAPVLGLFAVALVAGAVFCVRSRSAESPIIRVNVFTCAPYVAGVIGILCIQFATLSLGYILPNYAQVVAGWDSFPAGCLLVPGALLGAFIAPVSGGIADRVGFKVPMIVGGVLVVAGTLCYLLFAEQAGPVGFGAFFVLFGLGQGCTISNTLAYSLRQLPGDLSADGNAAITTLQQLMGAVGTGVTTSIVAAAQSLNASDMAAGTMAGVQNVFMLLAVFGIGVLVAVLASLALGARKPRQAA